MLAILMGQATAQAEEKEYCVNVVKQIQTHRDETQTLRKLMGMHDYRTVKSEETTTSCRYHNWVRLLWKKRHREAKIQWRNPPHKKAWLCIHKYEGSWTDPNPPYYGGLQMDIEFQRTYGIDLYRAKGTADHWTPLEQMWIAERARVTRGFWPWPNTARYCHLI